LTPRARLARELGVITLVLVLLAGAALVATRLLFPRPLVSPDIARSLDDALGPLMSSQVRATRKVVDAGPVVEGFQAIMARLEPALPGPPLTVEVIVIDSPEINAFTLPGRVICVDTGLIRQLHTAEEMAAVLGHELGHVVNKDPLNLLARQLGMAAIAGALTGGPGATLLSDMVRTMVDVHYGREAEDRADAFSVDLLARASLPPTSFAKALELIGKASPRQPGLLKYLDPHSPLDRRIETVSEQARREHVRPRALPVQWKKLVEALPHS
jgi:Zn-dependent protease with chaperone function